MYGIALLTVLHLVSGRQLQRHLELEDVLTDQQKLEREEIWRSEAINSKILRIVDQGQGRRFSINIRLCISPKLSSRDVAVQVENIRYSNDGPSDTMFVRIADRYIGTYRTIERSDGGHGWNVFHNTNPIGTPISLSEGEYTLS